MLLVYIVLYAGAALWGIAEDVRYEAPRWKALLTTVGNALGCAGMILYAADAVSPELSVAWRGVFALLVAQFVIDLVWEVRYRLPKLVLSVDEDGEEQRLGRSGIAASVALGVVVLVPFFVVNYWVAFGVPRG